MRRLWGLVVVAIGAVFIAAAFAAGLFKAAPAFERMTTSFRPELRTSELSLLHQDLHGLDAVQSEFTTRVVPGLAAALKQTPEQFGASMQQQFPAVSAGMASIPQVTTQFEGVLDILDNEKARFVKADAIPTASVSASTIPWLVVAAGLVALFAGALMLRPGRAGAWIAIVLGLLLVVIPLAFSLPDKAAAADTMNSHLKPVYTAQLVAGAKQSLATMSAMGEEMQTKMLPGLAQILHMQPAQLNGYLTANFPAVAAGLTSMPQSLTRFGNLVSAFDRSLSDYNTAKSTAMVPIVWMLIAGGGLIFVLGVVRRTGRQEIGLSTGVRHIRRAA